MQNRLLELLVCPSCGSHELHCRAFTYGGTPNEVEDGLIICSCGEGYPIISGIPRLLTGELRSMLLPAHAWFFERYSSELNELGSGRWGTSDYFKHGNGNEVQVKKRTAESFGYEWNQYSAISSHYELNFKHYFEGFDRDFFDGKLVLDVGCGMGRHTYFAAAYGAEVVAVDLSSAIEVAYSNNRSNKKTHFIQADIYNLPLARSSFDMAYSIGVLHHLPSPEKGFRELVAYVKPGGFVNIYVYHKLENVPWWYKRVLDVVTIARAFTTRIPFWLLRRLSFIWAVLFYLVFIIPTRVSKKIPKLAYLAKYIPLHRYADSPFNAIYKDNFDRFSAPIENRYSLSEVLDWFESEGITIKEALGGSGWRVSGTKPLETDKESLETPVHQSHTMTPTAMS